MTNCFLYLNNGNSTFTDEIKKATKQVSFYGMGVDIEDIKPESSFTEDLEADSLDVVELIMALEEEFSTDDQTIEISDEDAENIRTVQNAVDFITSKGIE